MLEFLLFLCFFFETSFIDFRKVNYLVEFDFCPILLYDFNSSQQYHLSPQQLGASTFTHLYLMEHYSIHFKWRSLRILYLRAVYITPVYKASTYFVAFLLMCYIVGCITSLYRFWFFTRSRNFKAFQFIL